MRKMNKKFLAGTAFAISSAAAISGCAIPAPAVYGPPPSAQIETSAPGAGTGTSNAAAPEAGTGTSNAATTETGSDKSDEILLDNEAVTFGIPSQDNTDSDTLTETSEEITAFSDIVSSEEVQPAVYGPPESFGRDENGNNITMGMFDPSEEVQEDVYGPPEYFN